MIFEHISLFCQHTTFMNRMHLLMVVCFSNSDINETESDCFSIFLKGAIFSNAKEVPCCIAPYYRVKLVKMLLDTVAPRYFMILLMLAYLFRIVFHYSHSCIGSNLE